MKSTLRPSFQIAKLAQADREFGRSVDNIINTVIKIPKVLPLATLLDNHGSGNHLGADHEHNLEAIALVKKRRKKSSPRLR